MKIVLNNAAEAGMPEEMIGHCQQLLQWRIAKLYGNALPEAGSNIEVLYSEKDPLQESDEVDDSAYLIYFTVSNVVSVDGANMEDMVFLDLMF